MPCPNRAKRPTDKTAKPKRFEYALADRAIRVVAADDLRVDVVERLIEKALLESFFQELAGDRPYHSMTRRMSPAKPPDSEAFGQSDQRPDDRRAQGRRDDPRRQPGRPAHRRRAGKGDGRAEGLGALRQKTFIGRVNGRER